MMNLRICSEGGICPGTERGIILSPRHPFNYPVREAIKVEKSDIIDISQPLHKEPLWPKLFFPLKKCKCLVLQNWS